MFLEKTSFLFLLLIFSFNSFAQTDVTDKVITDYQMVVGTPSVICRITYTFFYGDYSNPQTGTGSFEITNVTHYSYSTDIYQSSVIAQKQLIDRLIDAFNNWTRVDITTINFVDQSNWTADVKFYNK